MHAFSDTEAKENVLFRSSPKGLTVILDDTQSSQQHYYRNLTCEVQGVVCHDALREG